MPLKIAGRIMLDLIRRFRVRFGAAVYQQSEASPRQAVGLSGEGE
jgi:hypothetical protein